MATATKTGPKEAQTRAQREAKTPKAEPKKEEPTKAPPTEDVTGKAPEPKVKKTEQAREAALQVLTKAKKPLKMPEIVDAIHALPGMDGLHKGTIGVQVAKLAVDGQIKRVERSTYAAK